MFDILQSHRKLVFEPEKKNQTTCHEEIIKLIKLIKMLDEMIPNQKQKVNEKMEMNNKQFWTDSREKENIRGKDC